MLKNKSVRLLLAALVLGSVFGLRKYQVFHVPHPKPAASATAGLPAAAPATPVVASRAQTARLTIHEHAGEAPAWTVAYGREFWRHPIASSASRAQLPKGAAQLPASINPRDVIERVSHAFAADATGANPQVRARTYLAGISDRGLWLSPNLPQSANSTAIGNLAGILPGMNSSQVQPLQTDPETKATIQTLSIRNDSTVFYDAGTSVPSWSILGNTAQALLDPADGLVEHDEARPEGMALAWVLPKQLPGDGPLTVEFAVDGLSYAGQTPAGWHFADAAGQPRLCIGQVTVVDSAGNSWAVALQAEGNQLSVTVPVDILAQAAYPLAVDPTVGPEFGLDTPIFSPTAANELSPSMAASGTNCLVAWTDDSSGYVEVIGSRVSSAGAVLDPGGIPITTFLNGHFSPAVAVNGTNFLVVWDDDRNADISGTNIYGALVTSEGSLSFQDGFLIATDSNQAHPAVAANGVNFLVTWEDDRNSATEGLDIYGARVNPDGSVSDPSGIAISTAGNDQSAAAVAALGTNYLVVWQDNRTSTTTGTDIYGARVTGAGILSDTNGIPICTLTNTQAAPAIASNGTNYFVVWQDQRNVTKTGWDIYGARVAPTGIVTDTNGFVVNAASLDQIAPAVSSNGTNYLVVWQDDHLSTATYDVFGTPVTSAGVVSDPTSIDINNAATGQADQTPSVAWDGTTYLITWDATNSTGADIYAATLTSAGKAAAITNAISLGAINEGASAVAGNGTDFLVVWEDYRNSGSGDPIDIYGTRVAGDGTILDPAGIPVATGPNTHFSPAAASNGTDYLVAWAEQTATSYAIYGTQVFSGDGSLTSYIPMCSASGFQLSPAVGSDGNNYFVAWQDLRTPADGYDIYGTLVSTLENAPLEPNGIPICTVATPQILPAVACNGADYLVVWQDQRNATHAGTYEIYGARVSNITGLVADTNGFPVCTVSNAQSSVAVASNGTNFLAVWQDSRTAQITGYDVYGARVNGDGTIADPGGFAICTAPGDQTFPSVAPIGGNYYVVWQDARNPAADNIYGAEIDANTNVLNSVGVLLDSNFQQIPHLAAGDSADFLLITLGLLYGGDRTTANLVAPNDPPIIQSITVSGGIATITWFGVPGNYYGLQYTTNPNSTNWIYLNAVITNVTSVGSLTDNNLADPIRFYRVVESPVLPPPPPNAPPVIQSITFSGTTATITWQGTAGDSYDLQYTTELTLGDWIDLDDTTNLATSIGSLMDTGATDPIRFYRVVQEPP